VNNAGIWPTKLQMNADNLEMSFMVNHLAPFILSNRLLSTLKSNAPARIVNVNAGLYVNGKYDPDKTPYGKDFNRMKTYANTKLCNVLFTREFAQRIEGSGVTINALHPGVIRTSLGDFSGILGMLLRLVKRSWGSPEEGAKPPVWLATSPEVEGINGQYYDLQKPIDVNEIASDVELGKRLWEQSVAFAKLGNID
jgi:NAD(P)-dependent dehydrogenase (short-subunit alcohol dehydrogenase family)